MRNERHCSSSGFTLMDAIARGKRRCADSLPLEAGTAGPRLVLVVGIAFLTMASRVH